MAERKGLVTLKGNPVTLVGKEVKVGDAAFGKAYGVLIKELRLLARAVFVVDSGGTVCYVQLVKETSHEPDYQAVLDAVKALH